VDSVRPKRLKKRQTGRVGAVEAEFFNGLLDHYEKAADLALYRSGETQKTILREALLLAAYQGALPLYKRLKHRALIMGFSFLPAWDEAVANAQELKMMRHTFEDRFPVHGRFPESRMGLH